MVLNVEIHKHTTAAACRATLRGVGEGAGFVRGWVAPDDVWVVQLLEERDLADRSAGDTCRGLGQGVREAQRPVSH